MSTFPTHPSSTGRSVIGEESQQLQQPLLSGHNHTDPLRSRVNPNVAISSSRSSRNLDGAITRHPDNSNPANEGDTSAQQPHHQHEPLHSEDRLIHVWRSLASTMVVTVAKAEKLVSTASTAKSSTTTGTASTNLGTGHSAFNATKLNSSQQYPPLDHRLESSTQQQQKVLLKELDETVISFLRHQMDYSRLISYLEAKLEGGEEEMEILHHYHRNQARVGFIPPLSDGKHHSKRLKVNAVFLSNDSETAMKKTMTSTDNENINDNKISTAITPHLDGFSDEKEGEPSQS